MNVQSCRPKRQAGAVLFVSLIMLLVLSVIGVTAMQATTLEEKMAGNLRDQTLAFQASEAALREGEVWLGDPTRTEPTAQGACSSACNTAVYRLNTYPDLFASAFWNSPAVRTYAGSLQMVATTPRYLIEYHSFIPDSLTTGKQSDEGGRVTFRATSRGTGGSDVAQALAQSTYIRRF